MALVFLGLGALGFRWASSDELATLTEFSGQPRRDSASSVEQWRPAAEGDDFFAGDGAKTSTHSEAQFRLSTGARLTLRPDSQIRFRHKTDQRTIGLDVEVGAADVQTTDGKLTVDSEFGPIVIQQDSEVTMRRRGRRLAVDVEVGGVQLGREGTALDAGESMDLEVGGILFDEREDEPPEEPEEEEKEQPEEELDVGDGVDETDLVVRAGQSFTVHDPKPPTAIGFRFGNACEGPARLTIGKLRTAAEKQGNLRLPAGRHRYEVRCLDEPDEVAAKGSFAILQDAGTRTLPTFQPKASVATDGRKYTVLYQHRLPQVTVNWPSAPESSSYTLTLNGRPIKTTSPTHTLGSLPQGTHEVTFAAPTDPPRKSRTTTIRVAYDTQAPKARVANPPNGFAPSSSVKVAGQALPGWSVSVGGKELELDARRRFSAQTSGNETFPIAFSHPTRGLHYYLRRPSSSSP